MGPVALASLEHVGQHFEVVLVVTKPAAVSTQRARVQPTLSQWAQARGVPLMEVATGAKLEQLFLAQEVRTKLGLVVDFGIIISESIIGSFPLGILNSHFSMLPEWRGADPITFALLSGQTHTGVSIMRIAPRLDEGDLLAQERLTIGPQTTGPELTDQLVALSNKLLTTVIPRYIAGSLAPYPQDTSRQPTYSRKIRKEDGRLDWRKPAAVLEREVRAYLGWPGSYCQLSDVRLIITQAQVRPGNAPAGEAYQTADRLLAFGTSTDLLVAQKVKPEGKAEMTAASYLNGLRQPLPKL
jgi:methionyl-tRNA formyltransferase